jgi:hypothetical protein
MPSPDSSNKSLISRVFDLSFSEFVTPSIIKVIFVLGVVLAGLVSLAILISFISQGGGAIVVGLILAPLIFMIYTLFVRVMCEIYILLFRIEENTRSR